MGMPELILIAFLVIVIGGVYGIRSREVGKKAAARDLLYSVLMMAFVIIVLAGLRLLGASLRANIILILNLTGTGFVLIALIIYLRRGKKAGPVLLDIGKSTQHTMLAICGGLFLLSGILEIFEAFDPGGKSRMNVASSCLFLLSCGVLFSLWGRSRSEIREGGILYLDRFIKWQQIKSYEWEGKNNLTLTLRFRRRFPFYRSRSLPIPAFHKETTEKLLERYLQSDKIAM
jgi:hypothetical protein